MAANARARTALIAAVNASLKHVPPHPYVFETDRWLDLIVLMLIDVAGLTKAQAVAIAGHLSAARPSKGQTRKLVAERKKEFQRAIGAPNFDHEAVAVTAAAIERLSHAMEQRYGGGVQTFLRAHGERMVSDLSVMLQDAGVQPSKSKRIAILWLQNVANIPVMSVDDEHIAAFCRANKITPAGLLQIADAVSLNAAFLDDVLLVHHQNAPRQKARTPKAVSRKQARRARPARNVATA